MGLLDFFGGGTPADKAQRLKAKATQKYGDAATRQKALQQLAELKHADAVPVLMNRFTFAVDPQTTDAEEKEHAFQAICELEKDAVPPGEGVPRAQRCRVELGPEDSGRGVVAR